MVDLSATLSVCMIVFVGDVKSFDFYQYTDNSNSKGLANEPLETKWEVSLKKTFRLVNFGFLLWLNFGLTL